MIAPAERGLRVLLIDDSEIVLEAQTATLANAGFDVRAVSSLQRFLNSLLDWKPHVIVTDLHMPEMSGAELCTWIRRQMPTNRIPIVVFSSTPEHELEDIVRDSGADACVSKERGLMGVAERIREICEGIVF
ncbi:MAG: PleD family two-component system response regulator [Kofleriaceae bacterium]